MQVLVTAGGTRDPVDDVRRLGNVSSGKFGSAIAEAFLRRGHRTAYLRAEQALSPSQAIVDLRDEDWRDRLRRLESQAMIWADRKQAYREETFETVESYERELRRLLSETKPDVVVLAAAVADYVPTSRPGKIRSDAETLTLVLHRTPKIIAKVRDWAPQAFLVGFKLLSGASEEELIAAARRSLRDNRADLVVANDLQTVLSGDHTIHLVRPNAEVETYRSADKPAQALAERVEQWAGGGESRER